MRDLVLGISLLVLLVATAVLPSFSSAPADLADLAAAASPAPRASAPGPGLSGAGFALCGSDATWQRPTDAEQRAHLEGDHRFDGVWEAPETTGYRDFRAPAVLYDGKSADGLHWIANLTGLWNVWDDASTRPKTCWSEQPQVFLFGYEAMSYDAQDQRTAMLRVRPAPGYRMVVLTGRIREQIRLVSDRTLDTLNVPAEWVTPIPRGH